jgi:hypothetical protein
MPLLSLQFTVRLEPPGPNSQLSCPNSELELLYERRFTANQFILMTSPSRPKTRTFIFKRNTCGYSLYVTSSLTGGWVCRLQLLLVLAGAVTLRSESSGTHDQILLSQIRDSPTCKARSLYLYPPGTGWPSCTLRHRVPFSSPPTTRRATMNIYEPASTRVTSNCPKQVKVKVTLRLTVSQSVSLGVELHLGLMTIYLLLFDSYGLVFARSAL